MTLVVVEDEPLAAAELAALVARGHPHARVLAQLASVSETVAWLRQHPAPDVLLLDVHLADGLSFEIFEQVAVGCSVVFVTAYDHYAVRAFAVKGLHYLLKPVSAPALAEALARCATRPAASAGAAVGEAASRLRVALAQPPAAYKSRFLIKYGTKIRAVPVSEVAYVQAADKATLLVTADGSRHVVDFTLEELEDLLDPAAFFRLNRKFLTHLPAIREIHTYFKGRLKITLTPAPEGEVLVSSERVAAFKAWLDQ